VADLKTFQSTLKVSNRKKVDIVDDLKKRGSTSASFSTCCFTTNLLSFLLLKHLPLPRRLRAYGEREQEEGGR
jgi:hypothetical protein